MPARSTAGPRDTMIHVPAAAAPERLTAGWRRRPRLDHWAESLAFGRYTHWSSPAEPGSG